MSRTPRQGFIYFLKPRGQSGPIKIGFSAQMEQRVTSLSAASPLILEVIGSIPASIEDEWFLHRCFAEQYSHGEWFHANASLHATIENILQKGIRFARETLTEKGLDRPWSRRPRSEETKQRQSAGLRLSWARKRQSSQKARG